MKKAKQYLIQFCSFLLDILLRVVFVFRDLGLAVWHGIMSVKNASVKFVRRFIDGSIWTKLSHIFMGAGNFAHKQYVKGAIFLSLEIIFIVFMIASPTSSGTPLGAKAVEGFFTLGGYHGMPIDESYDFENEFEVIQQLPIANSFNAEYKNEITKSYRIGNVLDAISSGELTIIENDGKLNSDGNVIYKAKEYPNVVYDNRFNTNDYYACHTFDLSSTTQMKVSDGMLVWLESSERIDSYIETISTKTSNTML